MGGRVEALISAVNMTLKLEEYQRAAEQYGELLGRDLEPPVMKIIERKHKEAADKLAAQNLLRAENKARRRRACPTSSPPPQPPPPPRPAPPPAPPCPARQSAPLQPLNPHPITPDLDIGTHPHPLTPDFGRRLARRTTCQRWRC